MEKTQLRTILSAVRADIADRAQKDKLIFERLANFLRTEFPGIKTVFTYVSRGSEADTRRFVQCAAASYALYYPQTVNGVMSAVQAARYTDLHTDRYGNVNAAETRRGVSETAAGITVVPLLGFNESLYRIGYGKGCYDRYFERFPSTVKIGLAYDEQFCLFSPAAHDIPMDYIVTPAQIFRAPNAPYVFS